MRIFFLGVFKPASTNYGQATAFASLGHDVHTFEYRQWNKQQGVEQAVKLLTVNDFDLIVYSKCNNFPFLESFPNIPSFLWYMDPMHNVDSELIEKAKKATVVGCALWEPYQFLKKVNKNTFFIPEGFDERIFHPVSIKRKDLDVSFIGSLYGDRSDYIDEDIHHFNNVYNEQHNEIVCRSKINLNFTKGGCSDRVYKILAAGGFLLTQPWPNMEEMFEPGSDFIVFQTKEDLKTLTKYYLHNAGLRYGIAINGHRNVQKYTVINWAEKVVKLCNESIDLWRKHKNESISDS